MYLSQDKYGNLKQTKLILANPSQNQIGILSDVEDLKFKLNFNGVGELRFKLYKSSNGVTNEYYNKVVNKRLILAYGIAWFTITNTLVNYSEKVPYKEITCASLEAELCQKSIFGIDGVYSLYNTGDTDYSLLHIMANSCNWDIGHVDSSLLSKYRTFDIDSDKIYNLFTTDIAKSFGCLFQFDTFAKTISAYELANLGILTNIIISDKNLLKEYTENSDLSKVVTKMRVIGGTNEDGTQFDCRAVLPSGVDYIINVSYFMTLEWMSQGLLDALTAYNNKYNGYQASYTALLGQLKTYNSELTVLKTQLKDTTAQYEAAVEAYSLYTSSLGRVPIPSDSVYTLYQTQLANSLVYQANMVAKNVEITNKNAQITSTTNSLTAINSDLTMSGNFTTVQLDELDSFLIEGDDYEDSTFIATDLMTETEIIESKLELLALATTELARASRPKYTYTTTLNNLFTIIGGEGLGFDSWKEQFSVGNIITLKLRDSYSVQVRIMSIEFDFNDLENMTVTFSDSSRTDSELELMAEIMAQAKSTSSSYNISKYIYDTSADQSNEVRNFITGTLNATVNKMVSNDNQETLIDTFGIHMRKWNPASNTYYPYQGWFNNYNLMFTSDGWVTGATGIGLLTAPNGSTFYGVSADVIIGNILLGGKLNITNSSGTYLIDGSGWSATATSGADTYSVIINPSTPADIFKIAVNGTSMMYIDAVTKRLKFSGDLVAASGTFSGALSGATGTFSGSLSAATGTFAGSLSAATGSFAGTLSAGVSITSPVITSGTITGTTINGALITANIIEGSATNGTMHILKVSMLNGVVTYPNGVDYINARYGITGNDSRYIITFNQPSPISQYQTVFGSTSYPTSIVGNSIFINGATPLTSDNYTSYTYPVASHTHDRITFGSQEFVGITNAVRASIATGDAILNLGSINYRMNTIYASVGTINTSDRNEKDLIYDLSDDYNNLILGLSAKSYILIKGNSGRRHLGFIAQDVEYLMNKLGMLSKDFGGFIKSPKYSKELENGEYDTTSEIIGYSYGLRYEEFISPMVSVIQKHEVKLNTHDNELFNLKEEINKLKLRIEYLENK